MANAPGGMGDGAESSLDLAEDDGQVLDVCNKLGGVAFNALKDIVDERVEDRHGLVRDSSVG